MQQPGLSRAVPLGVLGFLVGALVVIIIRALQSLNPIWDVGTGLVLGTFFCAGFFVWGIGAFDPRLSAHEEGEEAHHAPVEASAGGFPLGVFSSAVWQVIFALVVLIVALAAMAKLGPALTSTTNNASSVLEVGMVPAEIAGQDVQVSTFVILAAFVIFLVVSLVAATALITWLFMALMRGLAEARLEAAGGAVALPASPPPARREGIVPVVITVVKAVVLFVVLYLLFYYVLIGLILPKPEEQLIILSFVNALLITVLIVWPRFVIFVTARVSAWVANLLRGGNLRGGKKVDGTQKRTRK